MKKRFFYSILILLTMAACTTDDAPDITQIETATLLTIEMEGNYLATNDAFYYLIQDTGGTIIPSGFGSLTNGQTIAIEGDAALNGLNISLFKFISNQNRIEAVSYLEVPIAKTLTLKAPPAISSSSSVEVQFENTPDQLDEFVFSANNRFTPGSLSILPAANTSFGIGNYGQLETTFTSIEDVTSSVPSYQIFTPTDANVNTVDFANNIPMENSHSISNDLEGATIRTKLVGYRDNNFESPEGNHVLYNTYTPSTTQGAFTIYSLNNFFSDYQLTIYGNTNEAEFIQITNGAIPSNFKGQDTSLSIDQDAFANYQISAAETNTATSTYWTLKGTDGISDVLRWTVYAYNDQSAFISLSDLPTSLTNDFPELANMEQMNLEYARSIVIPTASFNTAIDTIFSGGRLSLSTFVYYKTIYTQ
ncbi:hypothetical protein ACJD0Z_10855 [Flavobacteriaceae bacterium M23B6Z8]